MDQLPEALARRWAALRSEFESSCRSGAGPGRGVDAILRKADEEVILEELAQTVRALARSELDRIRREFGLSAARTNGPGFGAGFATPPAPVGGPYPPAAPTADLPPDADPTRTTDRPAGSGLGRYVVEQGAGSDPSAVTGAVRETDHRHGDSTAGGDVATPAGVLNGGFVLNLRPDGSDPRAAATDGGTVTGGGAGAAERIAGPGRRKPPSVPGYEIIGVLGRGGMGVVYKATQVGLGRPVALKMILAGEHATAGQVDRFAAEARAVAAIRHPNIIQIYEIGEHDGLPYFSLEFCPGGSLDKKLNHEPQPPRAAAALAETLARAAHAAHRAGVVHRDIKPANVLLDADGSPKVTDFGLARVVDEVGAQTRTGSVLGTPSYMSPEQALGKTREVGPASDQYSLGATLYDLLTGRPPFQGASAMETVELVRTREPVSPSQLRPEVPRDLETICLKALQKEPARRYASCEALADDLRAFLDGRPIAARPVGTAEKAWRWARRNPKVAIPTGLAALFFVVAAVVGATFAVVFDRQRAHAEGLAGERQQALDLALVRETEAKDNLALAVKNEKAADENYTLARESLLGVVDEVPLLLQEAVIAGTVRQQVLGVLGDVLQKQLTLAATRGLPDRAMVNFHLKTGDLLAAQRNPDAAQKHYLDALAVTERLLKTEGREKDKAKGNHALALLKLGTLARDARRNVPEALGLFARAEGLQREVVGKPETGEIPPAEAKQSLAGTLFEVAETYIGTHQFGDAFKACDEALRLRKEVVNDKTTPYTRGAARLCAASYIQLGIIQAKRGKDAEAEGALAEGVTAFRKLVEQAPDDLRLRAAAARAYREFGDFLLMRNRLTDATPYHEWDLDLSRRLLQTPEILAAQVALADVYYRSATLALKKGDRKAAGTLYRKCLELREQVAAARPGDGLAVIRVANARARCGDHAVAAKLMEGLLAKFKDGNAKVLIETACNLGLCADAVEAGRPDDKLTDEERALRDKYRDRALTALEALVTRFKYTDVVKLKTDPDLDPIRGDPRFQAVLRRLEPPGAGKP